MRAKRWMWSLGCVGTLLVGGLTASAEDAVDRFRRHVETVSGVTDEARQGTLEIVAAVAADPYARDLAIGDGLVVLYPEFSEAMDALAEERFEAAQQRLTELVAHPDPYLSTAALFLQARAEIMQERYEAAIPLLQQVVAEKQDYSTQIGDATYFLGMSQAAMLDNPAAIATLTQFLETYRNAPERMRVGAWRKLQELHGVQEGTMTDVYQRMDFSRRQLQVRNTGTRTQEEQRKIVGMLDQLIQKAEDSESQGQGQGEGQGESQAQSQGQQPGDSEGQGEGQSGGGSRNPNGVARRAFDDGPASEWSRLRDRARDPAFNAIKEKYPARYQALIEQYYKSFQQGEGGGAAGDAPSSGPSGSR